MNEMETRLAELLKEGVGDPPNRVTVQAVRHQRARRQAAAAVGAAAALAVIGAVSGGLVAHFREWRSGCRAGFACRGSPLLRRGRC